MTAARVLRRYLILVLMAALAVNGWPLLDFGELEDAASGSSRPWQTEQADNASAIIESLAEIDAADDDAGQRATITLAAGEAGDVLAAARPPQTTRQVPLSNSPTSFPNKTGPPLV